MSKEVYLVNGIGNRLNNILNHTTELDKVKFIWVIDGHCDAHWEDLFSFPQINMTYIQDDPEHKSIDESVFNIKADGNKENRYPNSNVFFKHKDNDFKLKTAKQFIKSLVPSKEVVKLIPNIPQDTCGYYVRVFHPRSKIKRIINIPKGSFLATDSEEQRSNSPETIQTIGKGGNYDLCNNLRSKQGVIMAVADWFSLFKCSKIIEVGSANSTFIDAHRLLKHNIFTL